MQAISHIEVRARASTVDTLCGLVATVILFAVFVTFNPFSNLGLVDPSQEAGGGEAPIYFALLFLTIFAGLLLYHAGRFTLPSLATPISRCSLGSSRSGWRCPLRPASRRAVWCWHS